MVVIRAHVHGLLQLLVCLCLEGEERRRGSTLTVARLIQAAVVALEEPGRAAAAGPDGELLAHLGGLSG